MTSTAIVPILATINIAYILTKMSHTSINVPWILGKSASGRFPLVAVRLLRRLPHLGPHLLQGEEISLPHMPGRHRHDPRQVHAWHFLATLHCLCILHSMCLIYCIPEC
jgi:hypothetical protein